jgi:hypothetical protein
VKEMSIVFRLRNFQPLGQSDWIPRDVRAVPTTMNGSGKDQQIPASSVASGVDGNNIKVLEKANSS